MQLLTENHNCAAGALLLAELVEENLLDLVAGERLWKLYCFISADGKASGLRHRIYAKQKADGRLALVTFAAHSPGGGQYVRSGIARVPDLTADMLEQIISAIRRQATSDDYEEIDLSAIPTLSEQLQHLAQLQN